MKKIFIYFFAFILICFILPAMLTKKKNNTDFKQNIITEKSQTNFEQMVKDEYKNYQTIKLLHQDTQKIEEVDLDEYLIHVVSAEMPADYEIEALKAQAIVARTYTIYKSQNKKHENADVCDKSTCCQAWISKEERLSRWEESKRESNWQKIQTCVYETKGKIITYENQPINAFFHANSGGITEVPVNVWGGSDFPYLQVIETDGEEGYNQYYSEVEFTRRRVNK